MDIPGYGLVKGEWDLRAGHRKYLGHVELAGKRVLEVGTASGYLGLQMEASGAEVVAYDLSENHVWDVVPYDKYGHERFEEERRERIRRINNGWWLSHRATGSTARVVYGTAYEIPLAIGRVDVVTFGAILLHLRDPFLALQTAARLAPATVIVTESLSMRYSLPQVVLGKLCPAPAFLPDSRRCEPRETWWLLTPDVIRRMLGVLGFGSVEVTYHMQRYGGRRHPMFTVVAHRT
jgi:hypothetical protein